jgi:gamma-glutamyl:cysteine ligase YbdK (ATP-grasp superfamily)
MGFEVDRDEFEPEDYERFQRRLEAGIEVLGELLSRRGFGAGPPSIGAELEVFLIDPQGRPLPINRKVLAETLNPRMQLELDRFNLEYNSRAVPLGGRPFSALEAELEVAVAEIDRAARAHGGQMAMIGILPTLRAEDLEPGAMTDLARYRALAAGLRRLRPGPFQLRIEGAEPISLACDEITFEGANTSIQLHLRVPPERFASVYNATQLATPLAVAAAANSPILLGHLLWEETRIALFGQVVDPPRRTSDAACLPARVSFGRGWVRDGAMELFSESARLFPPLLPITGAEEPRAALEAGRVPELSELRLHHGTVWRWNRAVYDPADGGHLRIEMRTLPAGPTVTDMCANAAFLIGLALGLADDTGWMIRALPFELAHRNFFRAARLGLDATLLWPDRASASPREAAVVDLLREHIETSRRGLEAAGVHPDEASRLLGLVAERVESGQTGSRWQRRALASLEVSRDREPALRELMTRYLAHSRSGVPVHLWPPEAG